MSGVLCSGRRQRCLNLGLVGALGDIVFYDGFEELLKWDEATGGGVGRFIAKRSEGAFHGDWGLGLYTGISGPAYPYVVGRRYTYAVGYGRYRCEWVWRNWYSGRLRGVDWYCRFLFADGYRAPGVGYDALNRRWRYLDTTGYWSAIPGGSQNLATDQKWHRAAFEFDLVTEKYIRMQSNEVEVDMSSLSFFRDHGSYAELAEVRVWVWGWYRTGGMVVVDDFLMLRI